MKPPLPSATPTWHNDTYPAIAPSRPELSAVGKTVIITGAVSEAVLCHVGALASLIIAPKELERSQALPKLLSTSHILRPQRPKTLAAFPFSQATLPQNLLLLSTHAIAQQVRLLTFSPGQWHRSRDGFGF